jgi:hypothetical protein
VLSRKNIKITGADINEESGRKKVNSAIGIADSRNLYPELDFVKVDINNIDGTAETLRALKPNVILHTISTLSRWEYKKIACRGCEKVE